MTLQREEGVPLTQGIRKIRTFESVKSAAANKVITKYKKWCQILWLLREKENNKSGKSYIWYTSTGTFSDKVTPDIGFTDEAVVQCNVPVVKLLLQMMMISKW